MAEEIATYEDRSYDPSVEPESSSAWLNLIDDADKKFREWQSKANKIEKLYASLNKNSLRTPIYGDREFAIFWANIEVLKPSIYARPPVPVVVPRFKDRRPVPRTTSELLERSVVTAFEIADIDSIMRLVRDDLAIVGRGVPWVRYETKDGEHVCIDYIDRADFLHDPARNWLEVGWVARRAWLTHEQMRERFEPTSGDAYLKAAYVVDKKDRPRGSVGPREKCGVWEIWSKDEKRVVWVTEGVEVLLDEANPPHLKLEGFFPCPKPAYATVEPRSLVPVPDVIKYEDQLIEIDKLTNRIHSLAEALKLRGFYQGGGTIGDAVEKAYTIADDRQILIPVDSLAGFKSGSGEAIEWLPLDMVATTIQTLILTRQQIIGDVYQIPGLSDIMRGESDATETATAQQIKAQYGSVRIRDKQAELVRVARDLVRIVAEIMAENFDEETLIDMSQMEIPTRADINKQVSQLEGQAKQISDAVQQVQTNPQMMAEAQANPEEAQQKLQQAQSQVQQIMGQIEKLKQTVTIEDVMELLRDQKIRPFVLDIETDSTIQPDEQAEKEARTEFVTALAGLVQQFTPMIQMSPAMAPMVGEIIKFALAPYRAGRELEGKIDEAIEGMVAQSQQPPPNPEAEKLKAEQAMEQMRMQFEQQKQQAEDARAERELEMKAKIEEAKLMSEREGQILEAQIKERESQQKMQLEQQKAANEAERFKLEMAKLQMEIEAKQAELQIKAQSAQIDAQAKVQQAEIQASQAEQQAVHNEQAFAQQAALNEQKARGDNG